MDGLVEEPCYTQLQVLTRYLASYVAKSQEVRLQKISITPDVHRLRIVLSGERVVQLTIIQLQSIIKLISPSNISVWFSSKSFIEPKITNTYNMKNPNLIRNKQRLDAIIKHRILSQGTKTPFQTVMELNQLSSSIIKYLKTKDIQNILLVSTFVYHSVDSQKVFKSAYESRFGKTGFGDQLNWKKILFQKLK